MSTQLDENPVAQGWYIIRDSQEYGPCTELQIQQLGSKGHLLPTDGIKLPDGRVYQAKQFRGLIGPIATHAMVQPEGTSVQETAEDSSQTAPEVDHATKHEPALPDESESIEVDVDVLDEEHIDEEDVSDSPTVISSTIPGEDVVEVIDDFIAQQKTGTGTEDWLPDDAVVVEETETEPPAEQPTIETVVSSSIEIPTKLQPVFTAEPLRAALFIDFDNVILGLERCGEFPAAEIFRNDPTQIVKWLEQGMQGVAQLSRPRRLLRAVCYSNPVSFGDFREGFINSGFRVVDCPPLTGWGKTAADMVMAIDILDTLRHETRFDEFILFSGDADFRPVLMRLKEHDRRTTVIAVQHAADSYQAVTDQFIGAQQFVEHAFGGQEVRSHVYTGMIHRLLEATAETDITWDETWSILQEFPDCNAKGRWMGFRNVKALMDCLVTHDYQLSRKDGRGPADQLAYRATRQNIEKIGRKEPMMVAKLYRATSSGELPSHDIRDYLKEFAGYSHRDHWMGFRTQWELIRHLVGKDDRIDLRTEGRRIVAIRRKRKNRRQNKPPRGNGQSSAGQSSAQATE